MKTPPPLLAAGSPTPRVSLSSKARSLLAVLLAIALSSIGVFAAPQAAHAADGVTKNGTTMTITAGSSPFIKIWSSSASATFQVTSAAHGDMVYPRTPDDFVTAFSFGDFSTGTITAPSTSPISPILSSYPGTPTRDYTLDKIGGSGTPADPWWFEMGVSNASYQFIQRVSYAAGAPSVRVDHTVKNISSTDFQSTHGQITTGLDCVFGGSDTGPVFFEGDAIQCASGDDPNGARMTYIPIQAPRLVAGGDGGFTGDRASFGSRGVRTSGPSSDRYWDPATHTCYDVNSSSVNPQVVDCGSNNDNGMVFSWAVPSIPAGQSVTRSYAMSFDADLPVVALSPNVTVDQPTIGLGGQVTYTVTVANAGPDSAPNAQAVVKLPTGMEFVSSNGDYDPATGVWETGAIAAGGTATLTLVAQATTVGQKSLGVSQIVSNTIDTTLCAIGAEQNCGLSATVTVASSADLTRSTIAASPATVTADGTPSTVTVSLKDALGDPFTGPATVAISSTVGTVDAVTNNGDGTYTATVRSTELGTGVLSFTVDGTPASATTNVVFTTGAVSAADSDLTVTGGTRTADGNDTHTATVTARDAQGHPVAGATIRFAVGSGATVGTPTAVTDGNGVATTSVSSTTSGSYSVSATTEAGAEINGSPKSVAFTAGAVDLTKSEITTDRQSIRADGAETSVITVRLRDANGNAIASGGDAVVISSSGGTLSTTTDNGDGTYTAHLTSSAAGFATVSFIVSGVSSANTATVAFTDATPPDAPVVDPSDGSALTGTAEPGSTVTATDPDGKVIGSAVAGADGRFTIIAEPRLADGTVVTLVATDDAGNVSAPAQVTVRVPVVVEPPQDTIVAAVPPVDNGQLAHTGSDVSEVAWWSLLLLAVGCGSILLIAARRRKEKDATE